MKKNVPRVFYHPGHVFHAIGIQNVQFWIFTFTKIELFVYLENDCKIAMIVGFHVKEKESGSGQVTQGPDRNA